MPLGERTDATFETYLGTEEIAFGERDVELLASVDEHGSLNRAASELGRSYSRVQQRIVELEETFGPLVERTRGGAGGGGSQLTGDARRLLTRFERMKTAAVGVSAVAETVLPGTVIEREGELATVETAAGSVRALVSSGGERVELTVRSDAVTLTAPGEAPEPAGTSARNRFEGTVSDVDAGAAIARVAVDVGVDRPLLALLTLASVEKLGLEAGDPVVATFKATATRGVAVE